MAKLEFLLTDIEDKEIDIDAVLSYELSMDVDAPCHGLRLYFTCSASLPELYRVKVYNDDKCIFGGYVDTQRESVSDDGITCFVYARSSACLLVDNHAKPCTYYRPCTSTLYLLNAKDYGFSCDLPTIYCDDAYMVTGGKSCWAAINDFVFGMTGKNIVVTADDCITLTSTGARSAIDAHSVLSVQRVINRGDALCQIDYKSSDPRDYVNHFKSRYFEKKRIFTSKKKNLGIIPNWQKKNALHNQLASAASDYRYYVVKLDGMWSGELGDLVDMELGEFGLQQDLMVASVRYSMSSAGVTTALTLRQGIDLEEIDYVAE